VAKTLEVFSSKLCDEVDLRKLVGELPAVVKATEQLIHVLLSLRLVHRESAEE
jgi:hypothetical protein